MKNSNYKSLIVILLLFFIVSCSNQNTGIEGEWVEFSYMIGSGDEEMLSNAKLIVEKSTHRAYRDRIQFTVEWRAINTSRTPSVYAWHNKALMDKDGRLFEPYDGQESRSVQPLDETSILTIWYNLPQAVAVDELYWGLYSGNPNEGLKYKVKLTPERTN